MCFVLAELAELRHLGEGTSLGGSANPRVYSWIKIISHHRERWEQQPSPGPVGGLWAEKADKDFTASTRLSRVRCRA